MQPVNSKLSGAWGVRVIAEANIQAEFYHCCRLIGMRCLLEFDTPVGRLDIAVLSPAGDAVVAIVECKRRVPAGARLWTRQMCRYRSLGVAFYTLSSLEEAKHLCVKIFDAAETPGLSLAALASVPRILRGRRARLAEMDEDLNVRH